MKIICCTGDSHTWGQGASGILESLSPSAVTGDLRVVPFSPPCYVSLLREYVNKKTRSSAYEFDAKKISETNNLSYDNGCAVLKMQTLQIVLSCGLIRVEFKCQTKESRAEILIDGAMHTAVNLKVENNENAYRLLALRTDGPEKAHTVEIRSLAGEVLVYRIEAYCGNYAVLNCGVGSCTAENYLKSFWRPYVLDCGATAVIMEAHTINDWLAEKPPIESERTLTEMAKQARQCGAVPIIMSVSPILGNQANKVGIDYGEYVSAGKNAALSNRIRLIDANRIMSEMLMGIEKDNHEKYLFDDKWHVNNLGHRVYAEQIIKALEAEGII